MNKKKTTPQEPHSDKIDQFEQEAFTNPESETLTTSLGVPVGDNQNSLKAGERGPSLLEDFLLRDKLIHFDRERIPERVVHARVIVKSGVWHSGRFLC